VGDNAGNSVAISGSFTVDSLAPTVSNVKPGGIITATSATVSVDYADANSGVNSATVAVYLDGTPLPGCTATATSVSCPASGLSLGDHFITGQVSDNAGNSALINGSFAVGKSPSFWSWYDDAGGDDWVLLANPSGAAHNLTYSLSIGNNLLSLAEYGNGVVTPGSSITPRYTGMVGGPVESALHASQDPLYPGIASQRILWPKGGSSLEEVPATDSSRLSSDYFWTWYDENSAGMMNWVMVSNPSASGDVYYQVRIAGSAVSSGKLGPGEHAQPTFAGVIGGPVEAKGCSAALAGDGTCAAAPMNLIASQRVLSGGGSAFNELPGIPAGSLSDTYYWTWYDQKSSGAKDWVMVANPGQSQVYYQITIAGLDPGPGSSGTIAPGSYVTPSFAGKIGGPVKLEAWTGPDKQTPANVIASQRSIWGPSFEEVPGTPAADLSSPGMTYRWTWYDQKSPGATNWVMVSNPNSTPIYYEITVAGQDPGPGSKGTIASGQDVTPYFPGKMGGPVEVTAWTDSSKTTVAPFMASQRVLWKGYFNETLGDEVALAR
jgi:hypothetical protein